MKYAVRRFALAMFALPLVLGASAARASVISDLFSTGVDNAGVVLPDGSPDPHYTLVSSVGYYGPGFPAGGPGFVTLTGAFPIGGMPAAWNDTVDGVSKWISPTPTAGLGYPPGTYVWETQFTLPSGFTTASINGQWMNDDWSSSVLLNGSPMGISKSDPGYLNFDSFNINSGFVSGVNKLDFVVENAGGPTGLRVELTGSYVGGTITTTVPEPASVSILGLGIGTLFAVVRRRRR